MKCGRCEREVCSDGCEGGLHVGREHLAGHFLLVSRIAPRRQHVIDPDHVARAQQRVGVHDGDAHVLLGQPMARAEVREVSAARCGVGGFARAVKRRGRGCETESAERLSAQSASLMRRGTALSWRSRGAVAMWMAPERRNGWRAVDTERVREFKGVFMQRPVG